MEQRFPGYGFASHKGYGTKQHMQALAELGPCVEHRKSYEPVRKVIEERSGAGVTTTTTASKKKNTSI